MSGGGSALPHFTSLVRVWPSVPARGLRTPGVTKDILQAMETGAEGQGGSSSHVCLLSTCCWTAQPPPLQPLALQGRWCGRGSQKEEAVLGGGNGRAQGLNPGRPAGHGRGCCRVPAHKGTRGTGHCRGLSSCSLLPPPEQDAGPTEWLSSKAKFKAIATSVPLNCLGQGSVKAPHKGKNRRHSGFAGHTDPASVDTILPFGHDSSRTHSVKHERGCVPIKLYLATRAAGHGLWLAGLWPRLSRAVVRRPQCSASLAGRAPGPGLGYWVREVGGGPGLCISNESSGISMRTA